MINAVTKSGTNQYRGSGFTFLRDSDLGDAKNFFTNTVQPFHEKEMGLNGGGPIKRDRAFLFASYEYQGRTVTAIPKTGFASFDVPASNDITRHYTTGRIDLQLGQSHRLFVRSSKYNWEQINVGVAERNVLSNGYTRPSKNTDLSVGDTWVISNQLVHEIRAGFSKIDNQLVSNSTLPLHTFPSIVLGSPTNSPQWWKELNLQVNNSLSYFIPSWHGEHSLKAGFQFFQPHYSGAFPSAEPWGASYTFPTDPRDPNDPSTYPAPNRYQVVLGDPSYKILNTTYAGFFKDDWRLSTNFTMNLGFRYDIELGTINTDLQNPIVQQRTPIATLPVRQSDGAESVIHQIRLAALRSTPSRPRIFRATSSRSPTTTGHPRRIRCRSASPSRSVRARLSKWITCTATASTSRVRAASTSSKIR